MARRMFVAGLVLALASPLSAQDKASQAELKAQIQIFEAVLQRAVLQGAEKLATQFNSPYAVLATTTDARARGVPLPSGMFFDVQVPPLLQTFTRYLSQVQRMPPGGGANQGGGTNRVTATGVPVPDPMTPPAVTMPPDRGYTELVVTALIDAMIDHSGPLSIKDDDYLTIAASEPPGPLSSLNNQGETFLLSIKGSDLAAYRQQKISKDEARKRVVLKSF